ncbi:hypothetical protein K8Z61_11605 [Nocardioides sp. TRM66260-LWL]|uniref:hypothetical protein n=1 Tax=Nocardioides sp. TRM66260-LWL TaxID=2874478 RepID=UPI001CC35B3A|nr:hypothetical protein [Nocardioides sp. TRM66260-LWL]MBZ5735140.1 hypothetical protein [Nocardioides sp. TRM66260-LWL]
MRVDAFGVPDTLLGPLPDEFYGAVGRIICLSALLENKMLSLYQALTGSQQDEHTRLPLSELVNRCSAVVSAAGPSDTRDRMSTYLVLVDSATKDRNDYAHNLWPAQPDGQFFGWRPGRATRASDNEDQMTSKNFADLQGTIDLLVASLAEWPHCFALVSGTPDEFR